MSTKASTLAHLVDDTAVSTPGVVHDPASPLVLGDQLAGNYVVQSYNPISFRWEAQIVGHGGLNSGSFSLNDAGALLINGQTVDQIPAIASAVTAAQAAATDSQGFSDDSSNSAGDSLASANAASASAGDANTAALAATDSAADALASANDAAAQALATRLVDVSATAITANETYSATFLNTVRRAAPAGLITITIPANIHTSGLSKEALGFYRLENSTGSIKFQAAAGGTTLVPPQIKYSARFPNRIKTPPTTNTALTHVFPAVVPAITDGKLVVVVPAQIAGSGHTCTISSSPALTWTTKKTIPTTQPAPRESNYAIFEAPLVAFAAATVTITLTLFGQLQCDGPIVHAIEGTAGAMIVPTVYPENSGTAAGSVSVTVPAVPAQSLVIADGAMRGAVGSTPSSALSSFSSNVSLISKGDSTGAVDTTVTTSHTYSNLCYGAASGVPNTTGDFSVTANFSAATYQPALVAFAYPPKSVIGGADMTLHFKNGLDTLTADWGMAQIMFSSDGKNAHVSIDA